MESAMIDQTLTFRLCGTEALAACCWSHGLPPCRSGSYIEGECVLRSGSFTFATFNCTVSDLVLLPFVGSVPAVWGFIWLNHFSFLAVLYPFCPLLCCRPPHLSNYPHICHLWPLLPHLCLINPPLPPCSAVSPIFLGHIYHPLLCLERYQVLDHRVSRDCKSEMNCFIWEL